jgi:hypothetical protein
VAQGAAIFLAGTGRQNSEICPAQLPLPKSSAPPKCSGADSANAPEARSWAADAAAADTLAELVRSADLWHGEQEVNGAFVNVLP